MTQTRFPTAAVGVAVALLSVPQMVQAQEFAYFGASGPANWSKLNPDWTACSAGSIQSPVDFGRVTLNNSRVRRLSVQYGVTTGEIFNNGHTVEVETIGANVLTLDGVEYYLDQFHLHNSSEHRFEGRGFDMEMHLVHKSAAGATAVLGLFLERGESSGPLSVVFENLPDVDAQLNTRTSLPEFDLRSFLPTSLINYRYMGSLTTPPCTEGVQWVVLENTVTVSNEDIAQFARRIAFNARLVQRSSK